jgi:hypothetical protein
MRLFKIFLLFLPLLSCYNDYKSSDGAFNYSVSIGGEDLSITQAQATEAVASVLRQRKDSPYFLDIVIYYYSSGKEIFSYSGTEAKPLEHLKAGRIDALVKIKVKNELKEAVIVSATGNSKDEILKNFKDEIKKKFCK